MDSNSPRASARLPELDGLRGLAALSVIVFHLAMRAPVLYDAAGPVVGHLDLGVEVFFVLSGFLVWRPFQAALARRSELPSLGRYALRRSTRIWPAYLLALAAVVVVGASTISGPAAFLKHASLTYTYFETRGGHGIRVAWTLVIELSFYAFVPLLALALNPFRARIRPIAVPLVLVAVGGLFQWWIAVDLETPRAVRILPPALLTLGIGMLFAAAIYDSSRGAASLRRMADRPVRCLTAALGLFLALVVVVPHGAGPISGRPGDRITQTLLQATIAGLLVLPFALGSTTGGRVGRALRRPAVVYVGLISFGLYLWHIPMLSVFRGLVRDQAPGTAIVGWTLALAATFVVAALSWHLLESPIQRAVQRRLARPPEDPEPLTEPTIRGTFPSS